MKSSSILRFLVMRHPPHKDNVIDAAGESAVRAAAKQLKLRFPRIHRALCTELPRSRRTAEICLDTYELKGLQITEDQYLGYVYAEAETRDTYPFTKAIETINNRRAHQGFVCVADLLQEIWPPAFAVRHTLRATMKHWAERIINSCGHDSNGTNVLVGNHASNVYGALDTIKTDGYPPNCSTMVYTYEVDEDKIATLKASELILPPQS